MLWGSDSGVQGVSFAIFLRALDGIASRVPVVWMILLLTYFNCYPFLMEIKNHRYSLGGQFILICRKSNLLAAFVLTLYFFSDGGGVLAINPHFYGKLELAVDHCFFHFSLGNI